MGKNQLSPQYFSGFCQELALLLRAGVTVEDGLATLEADFSDRSGFLASLTKSCAEGASLTSALESSGAAPAYLLDMVRLGEKAGRLEPTLLSLSEYYDSRARLSAALKSALTYPIVLILMLAAVVAVLVTQVLPIFAEVFSQMGAQLPDLSLSLIAFGKTLSAASAVIVWVLAALVLMALVIYLIPPLRERAGKSLRRRFGASGFLRRTVTAQFAAAMATAISSGLDADESVTLAGGVVGGIDRVDRGLVRCRRLLQEGGGLEEALAASGIFSAGDGRLLALGAKTGSAEEVMDRIARRGRDEALSSIDAALGRLETALVVIISGVVCAVLLSVMLPLTGIMSSI